MKVIVICGATASGKTAVSLALSEILDIEIVSADSRQVYKMLDIGTAKPSTSELNKIQHYFIDFLDLAEDYNAGIYGNDAYLKVADIAGRGKIPVVVGGSGLYIKSLCEGLFDDSLDTNLDMNKLDNSTSNNLSSSYIKQAIREELELELNKFGIDKLYSELEKVDVISHLRYYEKNPRHILRALEYYRVTGFPLSAAQSNFAINRDIQPLYFAVAYDRDELYLRINERVKKMWEIGLVSEVEKVLAAGYSKTLNSLNTVGYKETIKYLEGEYTQDTAISEIQKNTRRYAKRQMTWFRKIPNICFAEPNKIVSEIAAACISVS